ncbi:MAG TPA: NUDIX-like domain-containing protein, partial [Stellaceae bacterium]|nr:NUDIX-like domain-containing protein [Stellaceae bacterium]
MRTPNYYAHPGFERAGLRRREPDWIRERVADPASVFIPVWRAQNLVIELAEGEPRAACLTVEALAAVYGEIGDVDERFARGEVVFLGMIDERAHFALDVSPVETALDMLRSPAQAAAGIAEAGVRFADLRQLAGRLERQE